MLDEEELEFSPFFPDHEPPQSAWRRSVFAWDCPPNQGKLARCNAAEISRVLGPSGSK
jgi:hypothetical protein